MIKIQTPKNVLRFKDGPFRAISKVPAFIDLELCISETAIRIMLVFKEETAAATEEVPAVDPVFDELDMIVIPGSDAVPAKPAIYGVFGSGEISIPPGSTSTYTLMKAHDDAITYLKAACETGYEINCNSTI